MDTKQVVVYMDRRWGTSDADMAISVLRMELDSSYEQPRMICHQDGARIRIEIEFASMDEAVHFAMCHESSMIPR